MGKRPLVQRRGKGGSQWRAPTKGKVAPTRYPHLPLDQILSGTVSNIFHERGRGTPVAQIRFDNGLFAYLPAVNGLTVGSRIQLGLEAEPVEGNILPLDKIPEGTTICNIETSFGDGGKLVKSSGGSAILFTKTSVGAVIRLPSGRSTLLNSSCRATIGVIAGAGRTEKPFLTAGARYHALRSKVKKYPRVRGVAQAAVHHPFGGGRHQRPGKSSSTSRRAPPGRKIGLIAPRKTGRKRIARKYLEVRR